MSWVDLVRLPPALLDRYPGEMSGGQRQRVGLMRALFLDPELLLLDEPLGAIDPLVRAELQDDLAAIFARVGTSVVLVTHDLAEAAFFGAHDCPAARRAGGAEGINRGPAAAASRPLRDALRAGAAVPRRERGDAAVTSGRRRWIAAVWVLGALATPRSAGAEAARSWRVGSKAFTESVVLAELAVQLARAAGQQATHRAGLGGTRLLWDALAAGEIDAYPEYTGTLATGRSSRRRGLPGTRDCSGCPARWRRGASGSSGRSDSTTRTPWA